MVHELQAIGRVSVGYQCKGHRRDFEEAWDRVSSDSTVHCHLHDGEMPHAVLRSDILLEIQGRKVEIFER
jgi:hypothetical protein